MTGKQSSTAIISMESVQRPKDEDVRRAPFPPDGWPRIVRTKVFYGREADHWYALDADFDIATIGASEDEALASLQDMVCSYLNSCVRDGATYSEARRPIPLALRVKLHLQLLRGKFVRSREAHESELVLPQLASAPC